MCVVCVRPCALLWAYPLYFYAYSAYIYAFGEICVGACARFFACGLSEHDKGFAKHDGSEKSGETLLYKHTFSVFVMF